MSTRERWIVYPILFMTLGIAMRDKVVPPRSFTAEKVTAGEIRCSLMTVPGLGDRDCIRLGAVQGRNGRIEVCRGDGKIVTVVGTDPAGRSGMVRTLTAEGFPQTTLGSYRGAGVVSTVDGDLNVAIMGRLGPRFGVLGQFPGVPYPVYLTRPLHLGAPPQGPQGPSKPSSDDEPPNADAGSPQAQPDKPAAESL